MNSSGFGKGISAKEEKRQNLLQITPAAFYHTLAVAFSVFFSQRSADVRYAWASSYFHNWNIVAAPFLFSFQHSVLYALCTAGFKAPILKRTFCSSHIYLWHAPTHHPIIFTSLFVWYPPVPPPPGSPLPPFIFLLNFISAFYHFLYPSPSLTLWFRSDHSFFSLTYEFPLGHRWRCGWGLQRACTGSGHQGNMGAQQVENVMAQSFWRVRLHDMCMSSH